MMNSNIGQLVMGNGYIFFLGILDTAEWKAY